MAVFAVPCEAAALIVQQYGETLSDKVVVDITNPVNWNTMDGLVTLPDSSAAEEISKVAPEGARIIKALNTTFAPTLLERQVVGQPLDVFIAGDDADAKETVAGLVWDSGLVAVYAGLLRWARQLKALDFFEISLQQPLDLGFRSVWKLIS